MKKGFTLLEGLIATLISTVAFGAAIVLFLRMGQGWNNWINSVNLQEDARMAMNAMVQDLRGSIVTANTENSITFNTSTQQGVQYYRDAVNNGLIREFPTGTQTVIRNNIGSLIFCWQFGSCCSSGSTSRNCGGNCPSNSYLLKIDLWASRTIKDRTQTFPLSQMVRLRNE